ncbi:hypothetical protein BC938DRAFT_479438 [Jimgerdemannia flammicorona]|uniref:Uncharacterized protein n=1 Tax=Jimgerdemannia flammicorona TaxID=994334 RepID=A0A433QKU5_9FUNG|nr:hypothetical protein BC938DRAFT_479438 [Jimgerdemannia flammicorona]
MKRSSTTIDTANEGKETQSRTRIDPIEPRKRIHTHIIISTFSELIYKFKKIRSCFKTEQRHRLSFSKAKHTSGLTKDLGRRGPMVSSRITPISTQESAGNKSAITFKTSKVDYLQT